MTRIRFIFTTLSIACVLPWIAVAQVTPPTPPTTPAAPAVAPVAPATTTVTTTTVTPPAGTVPAPTPVATPAPVAAASAPVTHAELPELVKKVLMDNPEILMEAVQKLREKQMKETQDGAKDALVKYHAALFDDPTSPSIGDAKIADVTLVEFFDYHCGYCKRLLPSIARLIKEDNKVRIVFKEFPILSDESVLASRAALAVNRIAPDKYFDYHLALMQLNGKLDEKALLDAAKKLGLSPKKVKEEMASKDITDMLDKNRQIADDLGIRGTPAIISPDTVVPGALPYEDLKKLVDDTRAGKKPVAAEAPPAAAVVAPPAAVPAVPAQAAPKN